MQRTRSQRTLGFAIIAVVLAMGATALTVTAGIAMARGGWEMCGMCGGGTNSADAPLTVGGTTENVAISDFAYEPGNLQVPVGATVTWKNNDTAPHNAKARDGSWTTRMLNRNEQDAVTFDTPGEYEYYCTVHPDMIARLTVR